MSREEGRREEKDAEEQRQLDETESAEPASDELDSVEADDELAEPTVEADEDQGDEILDDEQADSAGEMPASEAASGPARPTGPDRGSEAIGLGQVAPDIVPGPAARSRPASACLGRGSHKPAGVCLIAAIGWRSQPRNASSQSGGDSRRLNTMPASRAVSGMIVM